MRGFKFFAVALIFFLLIGVPFVLVTASQLGILPGGKLGQMTLGLNSGVASPSGSATPTPTNTPTPTPSSGPTPTVNASFRDLSAWRTVNIKGTSGIGSSISGVNVNRMVSPLAWGAKCDGATDDTPAFNAAMNQVNAQGSVLMLPPNTCIVNATLTFSTENTGIFGVGDAISILKTTVASLKQIQINVHNFNLSNFQLSHASAATSGGDGIDAVDGALGPTIQHVHIVKPFIGINVGGASYGRIHHTEIEQASSDGFRETSGSSGTPLQWTIDDVLSVENSGSGFHVINNGALNNMAPWRQPYSFQNGQYGIDIEGGANGILDVQISEWTSSADCLAGVNLGGVGGAYIHGGWDEFAGGTFASNPRCSLPSGFGFGINLGTNVIGPVSISENEIRQATSNGINSGSNFNTMISNNNIQINQGHGILNIGAGAGIMEINGNLIINNGGFGVANSGTQHVYGSNIVCAGNTSGGRTGSNLTFVGGNC